MQEETKKFDAEVSKVLSLMIHSLYTDKEIFLRELLSNAADACDKLRYLSQTNSALITSDAEFKINITIDKENNTIVIKDNGIGMNKSELIDNLGTIAKSGTQKFLSQMSGDKKKDSKLIGQFGVGFYSAFMVADKVQVQSCKAGENTVYKWCSDGQGEYTISSVDDEVMRGTEIILYLKKEEEGYLDEFRLKHIVKTHSDHVATPIYFTDSTGKVEQINSSSALWSRNKSDITDEQYKEFYKSVSHMPDDPWMIIHNHNEGVIEFTNLLFIPKSKTFDLFHPERKCSVKLYINRVFIADEGIDIIPPYLRFLRGVVDSQDLPLNISRQNLQNNQALAKIKQSITTKVISSLKNKKNNNRDEYLKFWDNFSGVFKEGLCEHLSDHEKMLEVCIFKSALHNKMISLDEYIENSNDDQKAIYYFSGDDADQLRKNPQIEGFLANNIDVLLFTDTVDNFWVNVNAQYKGKEIKSVTRSDINIDQTEENKNQDDQKEDKEKNEKHEKIRKYFKETLGDLVKDVIISMKLKSSPVCLSVSDGAMDIRMERYLIEQKQIASGAAKILEINLDHDIIAKVINNIENADKDSENKDLIHLLYDQACVIEGEPVVDVAEFSRRLNKLYNNSL